MFLASIGSLGSSNTYHYVGQNYEVSKYQGKWGNGEKIKKKKKIEERLENSR